LPIDKIIKSTSLLTGLGYKEQKTPKYKQFETYKVQIIDSSIFSENHIEESNRQEF
jgi:hypothetical protein